MRKRLWFADIMIKWMRQQRKKDGIGIERWGKRGEGKEGGKGRKNGKEDGENGKCEKSEDEK